MSILEIAVMLLILVVIYFSFGEFAAGRVIERGGSWRRAYWAGIFWPIVMLWSGLRGVGDAFAEDLSKVKPPERG